MKTLIFIITITMYNNLPNQTDDTPNITATGARVHDCGLAVGRIMEDAGFKMGCRVHISGVTGTKLRLDRTTYCGGLYVINDRMNGRYNWNADIFDFNYNRAIQFGRQKGTIQLLWCE